MTTLKCPFECLAKSEHHQSDNKCCLVCEEKYSCIHLCSEYKQIVSPYDCYRLITEDKEKVCEYENMTVYDFLRKQTSVGELCVIRDTGYTVMTAWIDHEDTFRIDASTGMSIVKSDEWGTISILNRNGQNVEVDCHYIDI